jgi:hypothetical protein
MPPAPGATSTANVRFGRKHKLIRATRDFDVVAVRVPSEARRLDGLLITHLDALPVHVQLAKATIHRDADGYPVWT